MEMVMRILFITNFYPPSTRDWGYMLLCEMVATGLHARGHAVAVLTSTDGADVVNGKSANGERLNGNSHSVTHNYPIYRHLTIDPDWQSGQSALQQFFIGRRQREQRAVAVLDETVTRFQPDVIFIWHAVGLSRLMLKAAEQRNNLPTVYYFANYFPELPDEYLPYWHHIPTNPITRLVKQTLAPVALAQLQREGKPIRLNYPHVICVSDYVRKRMVEQKLIPESAIVIRNAVDLNEFTPQLGQAYQSGQHLTRILIAGRIVPDKGIHTTIKAIGHLNKQGVLAKQTVQLTILGDAPADYRAELDKLIEEYQIAHFVTFRPRIPRNQMSAELQKHHIFLLSSEYQEPLAGAMLEAMAMGMLLIGTTTGGSSELLVHGETGLVFEAGNSTSLAEQLLFAMESPQEAAYLASRGQAMVREHFNIKTMVDNIESYLHSLLIEPAK